MAFSLTSSSCGGGKIAGRSNAQLARRPRSAQRAPSQRAPRQAAVVRAVSTPVRPNGNDASSGQDDPRPVASPEREDFRFGNAKEKLLSFGFPKGSLQNATRELFQRAGFNVKITERGYFPSIDDEDLSLVLFRSQEISRYVEDGVLDAGICGHDWIIENDSDIVEVCELRYSKSTSNPARWVLAVPEESNVTDPSQLEGTIVASELVNTTKKYFESRGIDVKKVEYSWGATEVKAHLPQIGGIVDITETGSSLKANNLRVVDTILASTTRLIASKSAWADPAKRQKIEDIALLLKASVAGKEKVMFKMNLPRSKVEEATSFLPSEQSPTISNLVDSEFVAVEVLVDRTQARNLAAHCRRLGAIGIATFAVEFCIHN